MKHVNMNNYFFFTTTEKFKLADLNPDYLYELNCVNCVQF